MERSSRVEPSPAALHWPETNHPDVDREAVRGKLGNLCSEDRRCPRINRRTVQISHPNRPSIDGSVLTGPVPARVWRKTETKDPSGGPVEESEGMIRPRHPLRGRLPKHVRRGGIPRGLSVQGSGGVGWGGRIRTYGTRYQKPLPYHLATPQQCRANYSGPWGCSRPEMKKMHLMWVRLATLRSAGRTGAG